MQISSCRQQLAFSLFGHNAPTALRSIVIFLCLLHLLLFPWYSEARLHDSFCRHFRAWWTARGLGSALAKAWGCLLGPASPVSVGWACCCKTLPCGAGGLCMQGVCGKCRDLAVLTDTKEMYLNCLTLGFLMEIKFWWVLYNKQELLPTAKSGSSCPPCLASRLLTCCMFQECMAAG